MSVDLICQKDSDLLTDPCQQQICVESAFIPGLAPGYTKVVLEMVDRTFYESPYLISFFPFFCATEDSGISTEVLLRINVGHPAAGG